MTIFKLPDLGEGLPDAEISAWHVKVGDHVVLDQSLVSMETAKAVVEVPSPFTGIIKKLYGNPGDIIKTGAPLAELESDQNTDSNVTTDESARESSQENAATVAGKLQVGTTVLTESATGIAVGMRSNGATIKATPAVRALAQRLKVELSSVKPSGPDNTITRQDVENAANAEHSSHAVDTEWPDSEPLKGVRRSMAQAMIQSHAEIVPVTVVEDAKLYHWKEKQDITVRLIQAISVAYQAEPALNAWFYGKTFNRRLIKELNLGIAMDTPDGLFVPVLHHAETLDANSVRQQVDNLKKQVFDRSIKAEDLKGASFTLSNFGKFSGRYANPMIVPPMVAILGVGRVREEVVAVKGETAVCQVLPLSLTFDHRAVTGGEATRFLGVLIEALEKN